MSQKWERHCASWWVPEYCDLRNQSNIYSEPTGIKRNAESNVDTCSLLEGNIYVDPLGVRPKSWRTRVFPSGSLQPLKVIWGGAWVQWERGRVKRSWNFESTWRLRSMWFAQEDLTFSNLHWPWRTALWDQLATEKS